MQGDHSRNSLSLTEVLEMTKNNKQLQEKDIVITHQAIIIAEKSEQLKEKDEIMIKQQSQLKEKDEFIANQQRVNTERMMMCEADKESLLQRAAQEKADMLAKHARDIHAACEATRDKAFNEVMEFALAYVDANVRVDQYKRRQLRRYILSKGAYRINNNLHTTYADIFVDLLKIIDTILSEDDNIEEETPEEDFPNDE